MIILGLKLSHDAGFALIDNGKLIFSYECEKIKNSPRYSNFNLTFDEVDAYMSNYGYRIADVDRICIDGWGKVLLEANQDQQSIKFINEFHVDKDHLGNYNIHDLDFQLAPYGFYDGKNDLLKKWEFHNNKLNISYNSYMHISGHVLGAYCTSPFACKNESSYILVWDGGLTPQLYFTSGNPNDIKYVNTLFPITGSIYNEFPERFEPFCKNAPDNGTAGKAMAYILDFDSLTPIFSISKKSPIEYQSVRVLI